MLRIKSKNSWAFVICSYQVYSINNFEFLQSWRHMYDFAGRILNNLAWIFIILSWYLRKNIVWKENGIYLLLLTKMDVFELSKQKRYFSMSDFSYRISSIQLNSSVEYKAMPRNETEYFIFIKCISIFFLFTWIKSQTSST